MRTSSVTASPTTAITCRRFRTPRGSNSCALRRGVAQPRAHARLDVLSDAAADDIAGMHARRRARASRATSSSMRPARERAVAGRARRGARELARRVPRRSHARRTRARRCRRQPVYADVRAGETGWVALHPSQVCTHVVHAYSQRNCPDHRATRECGDASHGLELQGIEVRAHDAGPRVSSPGSATASPSARPPARSIRFTASTCRPCRSGWCTCCRCSRSTPTTPSSATSTTRTCAPPSSASAISSRAHYVLNRYGGDVLGRARASRRVSARAAAQDRRLPRARRSRPLRRRVVRRSTTGRHCCWVTACMPETWDPAVGSHAARVC